MRAVPDQPALGLHALFPQECQSLQQIQMGFFRAHHGAQTDAQGLVGGWRPGRGSSLHRFTGRCEALQIDAVVDDRLPARIHAPCLPVAGLGSADVDHEVGPVHERPIQRHLPGLLA